MSFYQLNLGAFAVVNGYLLYRQRQRAQEAGKSAPLLSDDEADVEKESDGTALANVSPDAETSSEMARFRWEFFSVYALAVAADWLQGPHIYAIYKYEKGISERVVALLYAAGFISGAMSASVAGELADRYGRRLACMVYCATYAVTCLTMFSNSLPVLFFGRLAGGISTTLLFSVFEAWMITDYHRRGLDMSSLKLSSVFGTMTTLSCIVAIAAGVVGDVLVSWLGSRVWPFVASVVCCGLAAYRMWTTWHENYGSKSSARSSSSLADVRSGITAILGDARVLALGITSCFFEGSMYLFIFFWSAALKSARAKTSPGDVDDLPYGMIFSCFMCAMMAGSAFFSLFSPPQSRESTAFLLMSVVLLVSACFSAAVLIENENILFWILCVIEACIGAYFPCMSFLKSEVVDDGVRGRVYSILRLPLNVFVVVVHSLDSEGDAHRNHVFVMLAALLMLSFFVVKRNLT